MGTVAPETKFEIVNNHSSAGTTLAELGEGRAGLQLTNEDPAGNFASLRFRIDNNGADAVIAGFQEGNQASSLRFYSEGASSEPEMTIQSDGFVGIGTTAPEQQLEVYNAARATLQVRSAGGNAELRAQSEATGDANLRLGNAGETAEWWTIAADRSDANKLIIGNGFTVGSTPDWLLTTGKTGIGITDPTERLDNGTARLRNMDAGATTDNIVVPTLTEY